MRKILLIISLVSAMSITAVAAEPQSTTTNKVCVTTEGSTKGAVVGGSVQTCVTTNPDGSRTKTETTCGKAGVSASVGFAGGSSTVSNCTTTTTNYPANSSSNSASSGNSSCSTYTDKYGHHTKCKTNSYPSKGTYLGK